MHCQSLIECFEQISAYTDRESTCFPLILNAENFLNYQEIMQRLTADETKQCIYVSEHTFDNGLPNIQEVLSLIKNEGSYAISGISQALMLQGERELDAQIDELLGYSVKGHVIVLLNHCRVYLEKYSKRDLRLANRIVFFDGESSPLPQIRIAKSKEECIGLVYCNGIKHLLSRLERISDTDIESHPFLTVVTGFSVSFFQNAMYPVSVSGGVYDAVIRKYPDLAAATQKDMGTDEEWGWLLKQDRKATSFSELITRRFASPSLLINSLDDVLESGDDKKKWLHWLAMRVFGCGANEYLSLALAHCDTYSDLMRHIYQDLLDLALTDEHFETQYRERKQLLTKLPLNLPEISTYCSNVGRHGKNAVYYLTDSSEDEEYTFMKLVDQYDWTDQELKEAVRHAFPELALYMEDFVFDQINTKLPDKDAPFRDTLTEYFHRYKGQKIRNHIDTDFLEEVNQFAVERPFFKLQPRSTIISTMNKKGVQAYFFDALGVEYLAYIQAKCEEHGLICEISIGHCELPSITSKNKEFLRYFQTKDISDLDELKHHSQIYDYQTCEYPIHIFKELEIIDRELRRIRSQLIQGKIEKAVIISDHGASRLAVIYKQENKSPLELEEKGIHSGRCCKSNEDPKILQAAYEDGFAVLGNYERFKGGRKANLEVHGGASLEEVVVPVITLALLPTDVAYYFVDSVIQYKATKPSTIELFSNAPMKQPKLEVEGVFYDGVFTTDKNHAVFTITEQKRSREYKATVYEGNANTGVVLTFRIERATKEINLFG